MPSIPDPLFRKLCYILHWGFVEARRRARAGNDEQGHDLADAFEIIPGHIPDWNDESLALIRSYLQTYQSKYGSKGFNYLAVLEMDDAEFMAVLSRF
jgi:hypothetical protein